MIRETFKEHPRLIFRCYHQNDYARLPSTIKYTHTPRAIFNFNPTEEPLIGEAAVIVVNDVRHELYPEFLQRTVPYFFTYDKIRNCYKWADVAFVQVKSCCAESCTREMRWHPTATVLQHVYL